MHQSHPQALAYHYHQLEEATLSVLFARDMVQNWWLYQIVLGINCFLDKLTILPAGARCCPGHLSDNYFHYHVVELISQTRTTSDFNQSGLMELLIEIHDIASRGNQRRIDFDNINSLSDADILNSTRLDRNNVDDLCGILHIETLRNTCTWSVRTYLRFFLTKLKSGMPKFYVLYLIWEEFLSGVLSHLLENASQKTLSHHI